MPDPFTMAMMGISAGSGLASLFTGGQRKPTWYEREMGGQSARLMRGAAPLEAGRMASLADLLGGRESAIDVLTQMYGPNPIYTPSPLLEPIREGLYGAFDPGQVRESPLYKAASENINLEEDASRKSILNEMAARGMLSTGGSEVRLENLERGTNELLNTAFMTVADMERQERTNRINLALGLLTGNVTSGATQLASTAGTLAASAKQPAQPASGGGLSSLASSLMMREYLKKLNPGAGTGVSSLPSGSFPTDWWRYTNPGESAGMY